jgi:hypothetical protein
LEYGARIIEMASKELTAEFGKGFSSTNLVNFKRFYLLFNDFQIHQTLSDESTRKPNSDNAGKTLSLLSWSHYERLLRVDNPTAREWYMREASSQHWGVRTLDRNISTQYYKAVAVPTERARNRGNAGENGNVSAG